MRAGTWPATGRQIQKVASYVLRSMFDVRYMSYVCRSYVRYTFYVLRSTFYVESKTSNVERRTSDVGVSGTPKMAPRLLSYIELTKPRITFLIVLTAAASFCLGSEGPLNYIQFFHTIFGITLLSSGIATLNQFLERESDGLMLRTRCRPLPAGKLAPKTALLFGVILTALALIYLALFINLLTAILGVIAFTGYLFLYTPLKTRTTLCTFIGAFPGAMPALMGWAAARGQLSIEGWVLFAILFLWQFPHFFSIAWLYREDYARAGIRMLPVVESEGRVTGQQIVIYTLLLLPVSLLPTLLKLSGSIYFYGALALGIAFIYYGIRVAILRSKWQARRLLQASVLYLPLLFALMVLNQGGK